MPESISQGIPSRGLANTDFRLYKSNDISFSQLKAEGFNCLASNRKPDQFVARGTEIVIAIEDKASADQLAKAESGLETKYLPALPNTRCFIARAGETTRIYFREAKNRLEVIGTTKRGKEARCFGPKVVTGENLEIEKNLALLATRIWEQHLPINGSIEIDPPTQFYNPLLIKQSIIYSLWQKIFAATGEEAPTCLSTFVELLLYKGVSDAGLLPDDYGIEKLKNPNRTNSLATYKSAIRGYIKNSVFPVPSNQPGVINEFAFQKQETTFKSVLRDLDSLGNLAQQQLDPDFKRRIFEAFLGSAHGQGTIRHGQHLTPRAIIQAIWEMANPVEGKRIVDPACGVGGFVLEGLNYPYEWNPVHYDCLGIDSSEKMVILAKANMVLHLLNYFADPSTDRAVLADRLNSTFLQASNNGTGTLGELESLPSPSGTQYSVKHPADYVLTNIPYYVSGVGEVVNSLRDLGIGDFYSTSGIGIEGRFLKYILGQIENGDPGVAFVIVTDGILRRHKDTIRDVINEKANVLGIISLPKGTFQNNQWKTSILVFQRKRSALEHAPVFLYEIKKIGVTLDAYRAPTGSDLPAMKLAWQRRLAGTTDDPRCRLVPRDEFLATKRWSDLFAWCQKSEDEGIAFSEFVESAETACGKMAALIDKADTDLADTFIFDNYVEIELGKTNFFKTGTAEYKTTVRHALANPGKYPLFSSQTDGPVAHMEDETHLPLLAKGKGSFLISWNIKGNPCDDIRLHSSPFYVTENRGLIRVLKENIDPHYVWCYLREHMKRSGEFSRDNEAHVGKAKRIPVRIPVDAGGNPDLDRQKKIAGNYGRIVRLRASLREKLEDLQSLVDSIDVFK